MNEPLTFQRTRKTRTNVFTMMLILSLFAIVTACVLLYMEMQPYTVDAAGEVGKHLPWKDATGQAVITAPAK